MKQLLHFPAELEKQDIQDFETFLQCSFSFGNGPITAME